LFAPPLIKKKEVFPLDRRQKAKLTAKQKRKQAFEAGLAVSQLPPPPPVLRGEIQIRREFGLSKRGLLTWRKAGFPVRTAPDRSIFLITAEAIIWLRTFHRLKQEANLHRWEEERRTRLAAIVEQLKEEEEKPETSGQPPP
jgi:hypothetical protein